MRTRGRPSRVPGTPSRRRVVLRLTDDEHAAVSQLAAREGLSLADIARLGMLDWAAAGGEDLRGVILLRNRLAPFRLPK